MKKKKKLYEWHANDERLWRRHCRRHDANFNARTYQSKMAGEKKRKETQVKRNMYSF